MCWAAGADTAWTATATRGIGLLLANATDLGPLAPDTPAQLVVALALRNQSGLQQLIQGKILRAKRSYGTFITPDQFAITCALTPAQV